MKENRKVINKNKYNKTRKGRKERLDNHWDNNVIMDNVNKRRIAYENGESVFNPGYENEMKVAKVKARKVIQRYFHSKMTAAKLNEIRYIIVVDCIRNNVLYLNVTSPKESQTNNRKYIKIGNIKGMNQTEKYSVVDIDLSYLDNSRKNKLLNVNEIRFVSDCKINSKDKQRIIRIVNSKIKNINISNRYR